MLILRIMVQSAKTSYLQQVCLPRLSGRRASPPLTSSRASFATTTSTSGGTCRGATRRRNSTSASLTYERRLRSIQLGEVQIEKEKKNSDNDRNLTLGEEVPSAGARGQGEEESSGRGGEEQRVCAEGGGEEHRPHPEMGGEIQGVHRELLTDVWSRGSSGEGVGLEGRWIWS